MTSTQSSSPRKSVSRSFISLQKYSSEESCPHPYNTEHKSFLSTEHYAALLANDMEPPDIPSSRKPRELLDFWPRPYSKAKNDHKTKANKSLSLSNSQDSILSFLLKVPRIGDRSWIGTGCLLGCSVGSRKPCEARLEKVIVNEMEPPRAVHETTNYLFFYVQPKQFSR